MRLTAEWVVNQISLPPYSKQEPDNFTLSLMWASNNKITSNHIKLNLLKSKAVDKSIPIYTNDNDGKPQLVTISKQVTLEHIEYVTFLYRYFQSISYSLS